MVKFGYTILYVRDVPQSVAFYQQAFGLRQRFIHESQQYAEIETGGTTLAFASNELAKSNLPNGFFENNRENKPAGIEIGLVTEDVRGLCDRAVKSGAVMLVEPYEKPWGQVVAYVRDLDGILIEICSQI